MERGYFHQSFGYWQTLTEPSEELMATFPKGTVEVPLRPGTNYDYDPTANCGAGSWVYAAPARTVEEVKTECDRRIELGNEYTLSTNTVVAIAGRERDKTVLLSQYLKAKELDAGGETRAVLVYRDRDNDNRMLTPQETIELFKLDNAWVEALMKVAWDMKDGTGVHAAGIPDDLEDDSYWP